MVSANGAANTSFVLPSGIGGDTRSGSAGRTDDDGTWANAPTGRRANDATSANERNEREQDVMTEISGVRSAVRPEWPRRARFQCRTRAVEHQSAAPSQPAHLIGRVEHDIDVA